MLFNSLQFAKFFAIVFVISWLLQRLKLLRLTFLLIASYAFYAGWKWQYLPLIFASSTIDYLLGLKIDKEQDPKVRKQWLIVTVVTNLSILGLFKYWNFGLDSTEGLLRYLGEHFPSLFANGPPKPTNYALRLALPVGISFYTFESMSYVIDVYRRSMPACKSYLRYLLFVSFFPHLVAGPIVRPNDLIPQFDKQPILSKLDGGEGLFLVAVGLLKKMVISDYLAVNLVDRVFSRPESYSAVETLAGVYGYAFQIYCDFSGYTDIAIGCALLLGIRINKNFASPYQSLDLQEFWRRWHISLSSWLRDYLYIPLGGSRGSALKTYRNLMLTMLLGGLWHGASWTFVFWGFLHGAALAATRMYQRWRGSENQERDTVPMWKKVILGFFTFHYVCLAWVFFRASSFGNALKILKQISTWTTYHPNLPGKLIGMLMVGLITHMIPENIFEGWKLRFGNLPAWAQGVSLYLVAVILHEAVVSDAIPFIYFQF
jgi:alginate O-acetyltransferase complex protein AlgI